jgi:DNA-binding CsgD family transcriptional regulator
MSFDESAEYDFLGELATAQTIKDYQTCVVPFCTEAFSVQSVVALRFRKDIVPDSLFRWIPDTVLRKTFDQHYYKLGFLLDPFYQLAMTTPDRTACHLREIAPDRFETSDYYARYFRSTKMVDEIGFVINLDKEDALHLSIGKNSGERRFRAGEVAKFKLLSRVLAPKLKSLFYEKAPKNSNMLPQLELQFCALSKSQGDEISFREAEVATLIVQGHSSRAIGMKLGISSHTVKVHRRNLYKKLKISSQNELFGLLTNHSDDTS